MGSERRIYNSGQVSRGALIQRGSILMSEGAIWLGRSGRLIKSKITNGYEKEMKK